MKNLYLLILSYSISIIGNIVFAQVSGCTDPQANNYNASATVNNGSCMYNVTNLILTDKTPLSTPLLDETSGLEFLSNKLWTFNDSGNPNAIYRIDTASNTVYQTVTITNATNTDWEDMTSNNDYLFIGDFGNNNGNRQNLKIYRIHKNNLPAGVTTATADVINFSYSDQTSFPSLPNNNNFDCESMIFYNDSIHLFSKNWVDKQTRHYVLPNIPGTYVAQYRETLNAGFLVTGATVQKGGVIALIGYEKTGLFPVYLYMLYDHKNNFFFTGNKRKFNVGSMTTYGQVEGVEFFNAAYAYISNEKYTSGATIPPKLRTFNLAAYLPNAFVYPKPKTQFAANVTTLCANLSVTFTDQSENDPTSWQWTFAGGTPATSNLQNPIVQYTVAGTYAVTLVAGNATGNDTIVKTNYITVNANPTPSISGNTSFCSGSSTTLDAGAGYSVYSWSTGATSQTISVSTAGVFTTTVTNANGCTGSAQANTTVNPNPTSSINGVTNFCSGSSTVLDAGAGYAGYNWSTGATTSSINVNTASSFTVTVTNGNNCTGSASTTTTINPLPAATTSPSGTVVTCNASQTITANSGAGLSYQWRLNGANINGATAITYNATSNGSYDVAVTLAGCVSTSAVVSITLGSGATATINGPTSFCAGSAITLSANAGAGISYQWYKGGVAQSGATSSTYLIGSAGAYYVIENSSCGTAASNSIVVTQINNPNPTMTYTTPTTFCTPGTITFTANTFSGVTYQWQKNSIDMAGAISQAYTATSNGKYRIKETANGCTKQGQDVQVTTATSVTAVIAASGPTTFCTRGSVVLNETNNIPGYSYQWKNNAVNIAGATTTSYTATTAGTYTCYVSASCGNSTSNSIVVSTGGIVALVNPSGAVNICTGATVGMSANTGTGFTYQWKLNGVDIGGATTQNYNASTAGNYTVDITSPCGNATSATTTVAITTLTAAASPASITICNGSAATFTANTGYNYIYQWYRAGIAIAGATSSAHANSTAGNYTVRITQGGVCSATSNIAALTVISNPNPTVTLSGPTTFCAGQSVTITANTFAGVTYQWIKGSTNIAGATNQAYTATTAGQYNVKETASGCTKQMGVPVVVTVNCREEGTGDEGRGASEIRVIPNPFSNVLTVSGLDFNIGDRIQMLNVLGEIVLSETVRTTTSNLKLQTSNLPAGVYFLQIATSSQMKTVKIVKQ